MLHSRTLKILALLLIGYTLLVIPAYHGPAFLESLSTFFVMAPLLSLALFHQLGVPGLLEHNGFCGWGWCPPTVFGWTFLCIVWTGVIWLVAWGLSRLTIK